MRFPRYKGCPSIKHLQYNSRLRWKWHYSKALAKLWTNNLIIYPTCSCGCQMINAKFNKTIISLCHIVNCKVQCNIPDYVWTQWRAADAEVVKNKLDDLPRQTSLVIVVEKMSLYITRFLCRREYLSGTQTD